LFGNKPYTLFPIFFIIFLFIPFFLLLLFL